MAARAKKSSRSRSKTKNTRAGTKAPARKSASTTRSASARSTGNGPALSKRSGRKSASASRGNSTSKRATGSTSASRSARKTKKSTSRGDSPIARVTRVAKELAHQATSAVAGGVETIKEAGGSLVDRVTT